MRYDKDLFWLDQETDESKAMALAAHVNAIIDNTNQRDIMVRNYRLYGNRQFISFLPGEYYRNNSDERLTLNVIKACVDTAQAKIAKSKPRPQFLGTRGQWSTKKQMQQLQQFIDGVFYDQDVYEKGRQMFNDAAISGDGYFKTYVHDDKVYVERTLLS